MVIFINNNYRITSKYVFFVCDSTDCLRTIKDPEKPQTLEDLNVVYEEGIFVKSPTNDNVNVVR